MDELVWEEWTDRALFNEAGRLVEYQSVGRDITRTKAFEATLTANAEELAQIADCMPIAMTITRAYRPEVLFSNSQAKETFGLHPGCSPDRLSACYLVPEGRQQLLDHVARKGQVEGYEVSLRRQDGAVIRALMSAREIDQNPRGSSLYGAFSVKRFPFQVFPVAIPYVRSAEPSLRPDHDPGQTPAGAEVKDQCHQVREH